MSDNVKRKKSSAFTSILLGGFLLVRRLMQDFDTWSKWDIFMAVVGAGFVGYGFYQLFSANGSDKGTPEDEWKEVD